MPMKNLKARLGPADCGGDNRAAGTSSGRHAGREARSVGGGAATGFTLIELMIVVAIIGIIAAIAYPSYINSVVKTKRSAAAACLSEQANYMERFYTTNLRYDQDRAGNDNPLDAGTLGLECMTDAQTGDDYAYEVTNLDRSTYTLKADPQGAQASRDDCGTLTLDQAGRRGAGADVDRCW